jgi:hypothetical protein
MRQIFFTEIHIFPAISGGILHIQGHHRHRRHPEYALELKLTYKMVGFVHIQHEHTLFQENDE